MPGGSAATLALPFPSLGLHVSPLICHQAEVLGNLSAGPVLKDRVGPATLIQMPGEFSEGRRVAPGMLHPLGARRNVMGTGAQPVCLHPQLEDCTLQVSPSGHYLDLDLSLLEQKDDLEGFYEEVR